jgi:hypothetical protein
MPVSRPSIVLVGTLLLINMILQLDPSGIAARRCDGRVEHRHDLAEHLGSEEYFKREYPQLIRTAISVIRHNIDVTTLVVRAVDQYVAHTGRAHFGEGDFLDTLHYRRHPRFRAFSQHRRLQILACVWIGQSLKGCRAPLLRRHRCWGLRRYIPVRLRKDLMRTMLNLSRRNVLFAPGMIDAGIGQRRVNGSPIHFQLDLREPDRGPETGRARPESTLTVMMIFKGTGWQVSDVRLSKFDRSLKVAQVAN